MSHSVEIIEVVEHNDEQVSYRIVCCGLRCSLRGGDPILGCTKESHKCHDSWHTGTIGNPNHDQALADHMQTVAERHERKLQWQADRDKYASKKVTLEAKT